MGILDMYNTKYRKFHQTCQSWGFVQSIKENLLN